MQYLFNEHLLQVL